MAISLEINGQTYEYPETGDVAWGPDATDWATAVTSGMLQKAGGLFQLLAETDFGSAFGIKSLYYKSRTTNPAAAGQIRLARADTVSWRNEANGADLALSVNSSNALLFDGVPVSVLALGAANTVLRMNSGGTAQEYALLSNANIDSAAAIAFSKLAALTSANILVGSAGNVATAVAVTGDISISNAGVTAIGSGVIVNDDINAAAAIAFTKMAAMTASRAVVSDGSGFLVPATTTATEIGYVNGVTSAIQTQLNAKQATITQLPINLGGTNSVAALNNNRVMQSSGGAIVEAAAITASRALASDANGIPVASATTATELGYVSGVTSAIQTQINALSASGTLFVALSADYTITTSDNYGTILMTCGGTDRTITLPAAGSSTNRVITIQKADGLDTDGTGKLTITRAGSDTIGGATSQFLFSAGDVITIVPNGTDWNITRMRQVEYTWNTTTSNSTDTTSFGYGSGGQVVPNRTAGTSVSKSISWLTPALATDRIVFESNDAVSGDVWFPGSQQWPYTMQGAVEYGAVLATTSTSVIAVQFCSGGFRSSSGSYASNGQAWSVLFSANYRWRMVKTRII